MRKLWLVAAALAAATPVLAQSSDWAQRSRSRAGRGAVDMTVARGGTSSLRPAANPIGGGYCSAPYKFAAGACVLSCPGGYEDRGSICVHQNEGGAR